MKKILINTLGKGNMSTMYEYANDNFPNKYKIIYKDYSKISSKLAHTVNRIADYSRKYDLVISDYGTKLFSRGSNSILINHGYGTKFTPGLEELKNKKIMSVNDSMRLNLDYIITMSDRDQKYYLKYKSKITDRYPQYIPSGTPRTDILFNSKNHTQIKENFLKKYNLSGKKIVLYAPTWRNYELENVDKQKLIDELKILSVGLKKINYTLIYRPHFINPLFSLEELETIDDIQIITSKDEPDAQNMMICSDILITDYSSMYVDFLSLQRPIIYCDFDRERYISSRGLAINLDDEIETPGFKTKSFINILEYVKQLENRQDTFKLYRRKALNVFYKNTDGKSTKRAWELIDKLLKKNN